MIQAQNFGDSVGESAQSFFGLERTVMTFVLGVALTMFFFPLIVVQVPVVGNLPVSGYQLLSKTKQFQANTDTGVLPTQSQRKANKDVTSANGDKEISDAPPSLQMAWTMPLLVFASFTVRWPNSN
jgi:hypothetical protein